jgi:hypothetical protein
MRSLASPVLCRMPVQRACRCQGVRRAPRHRMCVPHDLLGCSSQPGRSLRWQATNAAQNGQSRTGRCIVSRVPLLASGGAQEAAKRTPVSLVSTVSGHLGRGHLDSQSAGLARRRGTESDRVRPPINAPSGLVIGPVVLQGGVCSTRTFGPLLTGWRILRLAVPARASRRHLTDAKQARPPRAAARP